MSLGHLAQTPSSNQLMLWYKHHGSLDQSIVSTFYSIVVCRILFLNKVKVQIDRVPDTLMARHIYQQAQAVANNTYSYIMAAQELEAAEADAQLKKSLGPITWRLQKNSSNR